MLRAKARERAAKGLFLGERILDNPHMEVLGSPPCSWAPFCVAPLQSFRSSGLMQISLNSKPLLGGSGDLVCRAMMGIIGVMI